MSGWTPSRWVGAQVGAFDREADTVTLSFGRPTDDRYPNLFPQLGTRLELTEVSRSPYWTLLDNATPDHITPPA